MAKSKPVFDQIDKEAEAQAIAEAEADVAAGRVVPHKDVVKWLEPWGKLECPEKIDIGCLDRLGARRS